MDRRSALRILTTTASASALPAPVLAAARSVHIAIAGSPALKTLNSHQNATVSAMADLLIPRTETPGALDVRVNEFIDLILTDWFDPPERDRFLAGLADVDALSRKQFSNDFVALSPGQQSEILVLLGEQLLRDSNRSAREPENFYRTFRELVLHGYFTSQPGATQQLHEEIIPTKVDFCAPLEPPAK